MADKPTRPETPQDAPADAPREARSRMRAAPTIDLTAEEVDAAPADRDSARAGRGAPAGESTAASANAEKSPPRGRPDLIVTTLVAGFVGAVITAAGLAALWFSGYVPARDAASAVMQGRIAALQTQVNALPKQQAAADTKAIDVLSERLGKLEQAVAKLPARDPDLSERLTAADNAIKSLGIALTALTKRGDDVAASAAKAQQAADAAVKAVADLQASIQASVKSSGDGLSAAALEPLQQRIAALEQAAKTARSAAVQNTTIDKAARLALSAAALRDAVVSGAPFTADLKAAQSLGADSKAIAALAPFAPHGVPSEKALAHDLSPLLPVMVKASGAKKTPSDFLDRLQASAEKLVRVHPLDAPSGDDTSAVLARIELDAANADIAAALADLGKLPDKIHDIAVTWIARAKGRDAALAAARQIVADAMRGIGQP